MRPKLPECDCAVCKKFATDGEELYRILAKESWKKTDHAMLERLFMSRGCDLCGGDGIRIPFVPQIIKDFLRIEHLCTGCRWMLHRMRQQLYWPICWGSTSDDEIKWFLLHLSLQRFNQEVRRLSPAGIAKEKAYQEWLASLPKYEEEPVEDLEITIKPRFQIKRRVTTTEG